MKIVVVGLFILSLISVSSAQSSVSVPPPQCTLTPAQAPALRGFKLGMTSQEVKTKIPSLKTRGVDNGYIQGQFDISDADETQKAKFDGIERLTFGFLDEQVVFISVNYNNPPPWNNIEQLTSILSDKLGLPRVWQANGTRADLTCDGWQANAYISPTSISFYIPSTDEVLTKRQQAKDDAKRRVFQP